MLICESWKEGGEKDLIGQEEEKKFKQKEEKVPPLLHPVPPLGVPLPWPDSRAAPVWVEPTKASPLSADTPFSHSPGIALIR